MDEHEPTRPLTAERIEALVKDVQDGRAERYRELVLHYQRRLQLYCHHMIGNRAEAEDAVQEVFLKAYRDIGRYTPTGSFSAWLYKIAYRHCLNVLRSRKTQVKLLALMKQQPTVSVPLDTEETAQHVLSELNPEDRQLVILKVLEERSFADIAVMTGLRETTLRKRYERIRRKLNRQATRKEIFDDQPVSPRL